jgi:hypothetical protein
MHRIHPIIRKPTIHWLAGTFQKIMLSVKRKQALFAPDKNIISGTAAGTTWRKQLKVAYALSSGPICVGQYFPDKIILGLSSVPSYKLLFLALVNSPNIPPHIYC